MHGGQIQKPTADAERRVGNCRVQLDRMSVDRNADITPYHVAPSVLSVSEKNQYTFVKGMKTTL